MTVCPCCGFKFEGDLQRDGCSACGAIAVGPALSRPLRELPTFGRALFVGFMGVLLLATFLVSTIVALFERGGAGFGFWSLMGAAETAAWRLKWAALPVLVFALWSGWMIYKSIRRDPKRFLGHRVARYGLTTTAIVAVMMLTFIGITVPERLRQIERRQEASMYAQGYTIQRAMLDYRTTYGTLPSTLDQLKRLPDLDGSIAEALKGLDTNAYSPGADLAALPKKKATLRGSALRNASLRSTDDAPVAGLSFTRYELRLPGPDNKLGTEDDWTMRDGVITKPLDSAHAQASSQQP